MPRVGTKHAALAAAVHCRHAAIAELHGNLLHYQCDLSTSPPVSGRGQRTALPGHIATLPNRRPLQTPCLRHDARPHPPPDHATGNHNRACYGADKRWLLPSSGLKLSSVAKGFCRSAHAGCTGVHRAAELHPSKPRAGASRRARGGVSVLLCVPCLYRSG